MSTANRTGVHRGFPRLDELDPADRRVLRGLLGLIGLGGAASALRSLWPTNPLRVTVTGVAEGPVATVADAAANASAVHSGDLIWTVTDPGIGQRVLAAIPGLTAGLLTVAVALLLLRLVERMCAGDPFGPRAQSALRAVGLVLTVGGMLWPWLRVVSDFALAATITPTSAVARLDAAEFLPMVVGMLLLALLGVFRKGAALADDADGLV